MHLLVNCLWLKLEEWSALHCKYQWINWLYKLSNPFSCLLLYFILFFFLGDWFLLPMMLADAIQLHFSLTSIQCISHQCECLRASSVPWQSCMPHGKQASCKLHLLPLLHSSLLVNIAVFFCFCLLMTQIETHKLEWKVESRVGSLENANHRAGGGDKQVSNPSQCLQVCLRIGIHLHVYDAPLRVECLPPKRHHKSQSKNHTKGWNWKWRDIWLTHHFIKKLFIDSFHSMFFNWINW